MEWRYLIQHPPFDFKFFLSEEEYNNKKLLVNFNLRLQKGYNLQFNFDDINCLIVKSGNEKIKLIKKIEFYKVFKNISSNNIIKKIKAKKEFCE